MSTRFIPNKPLEKVQGLADYINLKKPDLIFLTEVGGDESISNFAKYFLDDSYEYIHTPSNSDRGIDLSILIAKDFISPRRHQFHSHSFFARGVLELEIKTADNQYIYFLLTHLKSKLYRPGADFEGRSKRAQEALKISQIFNRLKSKASTKAIYVLGDMNGIIFEAETEEELRAFKEVAGIEDILSHFNIPPLDRTTYVYFNKQHNLIPMQLDYVLTDQKGIELISKVPEVSDFNGSTPVMFPLNRKQKLNAPSDHYPVLFEIDEDI